MGPEDKSLMRSIASAARSNGNHPNGSSPRSGSPPVTSVREALSINGHASLIFHMPCTVSPHSWPMRRTLIRSRQLELSERCISYLEGTRWQICSATHLEREYPRGLAERGSTEILSETMRVEGEDETDAMEEQKSSWGFLLEKAAKERRCLRPAI